MTQRSILGISLEDLDIDAASERALALMNGPEGAYVVTPNPEILLTAQHNPRLRDALHGASLDLPDGVGLVLASRLLGNPLNNRVPGIDFASALLCRMSQSRKSVFLFGARPGVAAKAVGKLKERFPGLRIVGSSHGFISKEEEASLQARLRELHPDLLIVCLGSPKQEIWMHEHAGQDLAGLMVGLGGALDVYAGDVPRAPLFWRKHGLEWLFRLMIEPKRIGRVLRLPAFLLAVWKERDRNRNYG